MLTITKFFRGLTTLALLGGMIALAAPVYQAHAMPGELILPIDQEKHPDNGK